ncbi:MAG TPA: carboxypeptidase-like regulatory domain-containing protein [Thermoanaerobaculia bacterium]|jgi:hypothetical protein
MKTVGFGVALILLLMPFKAAAVPAANSRATVEITYRTVVPGALPPAWAVLLRPVEAQKAPAARFMARGAEPLQLQLDPGSSWEVSADLPGFWVPRKTLTAGGAGETSHLRLDLWPLGTIGGRVQVREKGLALPPEVLVKTVAASALLNRPAMPPGVLSCPVDKEGHWSCSLPAATFDLAVTAEGFTPHYLWKIAVPPAKTLGLGTFQLERGGSVAGWVAVEGGTIDPAHAVARLSLLAACDTDANTIQQLDRTAVERPVGKSGFLQFTGLAAGSYALEVRQPGLAPARVTDVRVVPRGETFLSEPLLLTRPIALELEIVPPLDERGETWHAQVIRRAEDSRPAPMAFDGQADTEGRFAVPDQSPGWFRVLVLDSRGNRVHSEPERKLEASARTTIELHRTVIDGRLRLGSEPLAGSLWFGGSHGEKSVKMEADATGHFAGLLPSQTFWAVEIEATEPRLRARVRTEVHPDSSGRASVAIDLPETRVFGRIVDQRGEPAPKAFVVATTQGLDQHVEADAAGGFDLRAVPEGSLSLIASDGGSGQSERAVVNALQGAPVGPVELRLRPVRRLSGSVRSPLGPVPGARIVALANAPAAGGGEAMTGLDGTFSLELPANLDAVTAVVKAPGLGTQAFPLASGDGPIALQMSEAAGQVAVALPRAAADLPRDNLGVVLFQNGVEIPITLLREDATPSAASGTDGPGLLLAHLAPGQYVACIAPKQVDSKGSLGHAPRAAVACDSGQLSTGATLALKLHDQP